MALDDDIAALPTDIDSTYDDDPQQPSRKLHQQHHDTIHAGLKDHRARLDPLKMTGNLVTLIYDGTDTRWEFGDGTVPTLTGRTASIDWEGTEAVIPAQGPGDSDFRPGDKASKRTVEYAS